MSKQKSIGHQRLAKLATFLYRVPRDRFNMNRWILDGEGTLSLDSRVCNTQGCAIGWATVLFADVGFCLSPDAGISGVPLPQWGTRNGWEAVEGLLDLSKVDALVLFENSDKTANLGPRQVAVRIRKFLKTGKI